ncbi:MAG: hypothetical protein M3Y46_12705, partial [Actinomycetota bacterium]|nr:hypothetical protein [Actinomycetota bacterium]
LIPAWSEVITPESYNWEEATVSDVRAFIGDVEYVFSGDVLVYSIADPMTTDADSLRFAIEGSPGNGSIEVLREFIQHGTIAFRINNGDYNVIRLAATQTEAETYYPSPG